MDDEQFLNWIADRLVHRELESENTDFVIALRGMAKKQAAYKAELFSGDKPRASVLREICVAARMWYGEDDEGHS